MSLVSLVSLGRCIVLGSLVTVISGCAAGGAHVARDVPRHEARVFFENVAYQGASFSHDESKLLLTSDATGVYNVYSVPVAGGPLEQLTRSSTNATYAVSWFPNDNRFLFTADQGGNELNHLYVRELSGEERDLTPGERLKANFLSWSQDGKNFFASTNERDPRFFDVYRYATDGYARELIFKNDKSWNIGGVSPDGRWISLMQVNDNADSDVYLYDTTKPDAAPALVTSHSGKASHSFAAFTSDSAELCYGSDANGKFQEIWAYRMSDGARRKLIADDWDVTGLEFSRNGRYRVSSVNDDARTETTIWNTANNRKVQLPDLPDGDMTGVEISPSEKKMAFYLSVDTSPPNLYVFDLETRSLQKLTTSLNSAIREQDLVEGRVVRYKSFDGLKIPAILYQPWSASSANKVPGIVLVHGGPGGQSRKGYSGLVQHLVNNGYAVLAVNNRGSSGYGKTFFHLDDRNHGENDLQDCVYGRKYLETLPWIDGHKIAIMGGSYGGFMVAAALTHTPEAFDAGINLFGVTNWLRTLRSTPPWWTSFRASLFTELGDPDQDEARLKRISPLMNADKIRRPLMVVQGANDPRVLQVESDELVAAARKNGVPVEYIVFPDEGHGFRSRKNRITASDAYIRFLQANLTGTPKTGDLAK